MGKVLTAQSGPSKPKKKKKIKLKTYVAKPKITYTSQIQILASKLGTNICAWRSRNVYNLFTISLLTQRCLHFHWTRCLPKTLTTPSSHNEAIIMFEIALRQRQRFASVPHPYAHLTYHLVARACHKFVVSQGPSTRVAVRRGKGSWSRKRSQPAGD